MKVLYNRPGIYEPIKFDVFNDDTQYEDMRRADWFIYLHSPYDHTRERELEEMLDSGIIKTYYYKNENDKVIRYWPINKSDGVSIIYEESSYEQND